jgi:hypothetical protein
MGAKYKIRSGTREEHYNKDTVASDPVLAMLGIGKQLWELEPGDSFVERLRSENLPVVPKRSCGYSCTFTNK